MVATAKRDLAAGGLPIGLAHDLPLRAPVAAGHPVRGTDLAFDPSDPAIRSRREVEDTCRDNAKPLRPGHG